MGTQLGVETQPLRANPSGEWDYFLNNSQKLAMKQPNKR